MRTKAEQLGRAACGAFHPARSPGTHPRGARFRVVGERALKTFWRMQMTILKTVMIASALLAGGTSLAMAQMTAAPGAPPPPAAPGAAPAPQSAAPSPNVQSAAPAPSTSSGTRIAHHTSRPHRRMYMQARHMIPGCTVGMQARAMCACGTGPSGGPLLCQPGQWCHYPFAQACTQ